MIHCIEYVSTISTELLSLIRTQEIGEGGPNIFKQISQCLQNPSSRPTTLQELPLSQRMRPWIYDSVGYITPLRLLDEDAP
jgi:hypothetical protein